MVSDVSEVCSAFIFKSQLVQKEIYPERHRRVPEELSRQEQNVKSVIIESEFVAVRTS